MHISSFISLLVFVFRNEEKLVAPLVYSLFRRVATSMLRRISVYNTSGSQVSQAECKWGVNTDSLRIEYSFTAQIGGRNDCNITKLVAMEHVQKN